jgi:glycosyltransferase involved in cell wall biosynthesis
MPNSDHSVVLGLPLVSLVVTSYNYSQFILDCLKSIAEQSYRPIECLIIDDCSTDDSVSKIRQFISEHRDSQISFRLVEHGTNKGQLGGFITGINEANGKFLGFVDADDVILPEYVNTHIQAHFKTNVAMTVTQQIEFDEDNQIHSLYSMASPQKEPLVESSFTQMEFSELSLSVQKKKFAEIQISFKVITPETHKFGGWYWGPTSNVIFRKKALMFFPYADNLSYWKYCADNLLFNYAHLLGGSCIVYAPLTAYRRHANKGFSNCSITGSVRYFNQKSRDKMIADKDALLHDILSLFANARQEILSFMDRHDFRNLIKLVIKNYDKHSLLSNLHILEKLLDDDDLKTIKG